MTTEDPLATLFAAILPGLFGVVIGLMERGAADSTTFWGHQRFRDSERVALAVMIVQNCSVTPAGTIVVRPGQRAATPDQP